MVFQPNEVYLRRTRIAMLGKTVRHGMHKRICRNIIGIDIHLAELAERAQVVYSARMIIMYMGEQHRVNLSERLCEHLLTEVGTRVNEYPRVFGLHQCRATQAFVVRVGAKTRSARTSYSRHPHRCSCSEKCQFHIHLQTPKLLHSCTSALLTK